MYRAYPRGLRYFRALHISQAVCKLDELRTAILDDTWPMENHEDEEEVGDEAGPESELELEPKPETEYHGEPVSDREAGDLFRRNTHRTSYHRSAPMGMGGVVEVVSFR